MLRIRKTLDRTEHSSKPSYNKASHQFIAH
jgi:hypothetical protein